MTVVTRFAPSPTGYLHIGSVRTALYCYLFSRKHQGDFILRIEDTDRERSTEEAVQIILDGLQWAGLTWDHGPFFQTKRMERYQQVLQQLTEQGHVYKCYCSKERLEKLREQQTENKEKPRYDGHCRHATQHRPDEPYVIRFKTPLEGEVNFHDAVRGEVTFQNTELDDLIIYRSDGTPTYNFCVVVDDVDMNITHVIRGNDHLNNTPRQIHIFNALNFPLPHFAHLPMILGEDGKRLSKRHGAVSVLQYRDEGYLPEALLNYLVRLGWSHGDQEIFSLQEMIEFFELEKINKAPATFDEEKLLWLNQHYIKTLDANYLAEKLREQFELLAIDYRHGPQLTDVVEALRNRSKTLKEMALASQCFYQDIDAYNAQSAEKFLSKEIVPALNDFILGLEKIHTEQWNHDNINNLVKEIIKQHDLKMPQLAQPIRIALTGDITSPGIGDTVFLVGYERSVSRIKKLIEYII